MNRNNSLHEVYEVRKNQIRSNQLEQQNQLQTAQQQSALQTSYTCDDIDAVYMPWMIENYGRKLAIEALKRRGNMCGESTSQTTLWAPQKTAEKEQHPGEHQKRTKSPYVSQYYAPSPLLDRPTASSSSFYRPNDLWLIDRGVRRRLKRSARQQQQQQQSSSRIVAPNSSSNITARSIQSHDNDQSDEVETDTFLHSFKSILVSHNRAFKLFFLNYFMTCLHFKDRFNNEFCLIL